MANLGKRLVVVTRARLSVSSPSKSVIHYLHQQSSKYHRSGSMMILAHINGPMRLTSFISRPVFSNSRLMFRRFYGSEVEGGEEGNGSNKNKYEYVEPIESYDDLEVVLKEKTDMMERVSIIREVLDLFEEKIDNKQSTTSYVPVRGEDGMMKLITTEHETEVVVQLGRIILRCLIEPVENKGELILIKQYEESKKSMEAEAEARKDAPPITNLKKKEKVEKRWEAGLFSLNNLKEKIRFWRGLSLAEAYVIGVIRKFSTDARALQSRLCAALSNRDFYKPAEYRDLLLSVTEAMEKKNLTPREQVNELKSLF